MLWQVKSFASNQKHYSAISGYKVDWNRNEQNTTAPVRVKSAVLYDVTLYSLVWVYQCFRETY